MEKRLSARQSNVKRAHIPCLTCNSEPFIGRKHFALPFGFVFVQTDVAHHASEIAKRCEFEGCIEGNKILFRPIADLFKNISAQALTVIHRVHPAP